MLHCPLSFNHVFHRNLFPLSQRGELREKRCGLLPNRGKLYFLQRGGREEERMDGFPTTKETRNAVREKERKKRGKMARDTGGIIVTSKTRDTPLLPPPQFSSKRTRRKVSSLVSVAHALEIVADPAKKKLSNFIHNGRSAANFQHPRTRPSSNREFVRFRSRIFIPEVPTRGTRLVGAPVLFKGTAYTSVETSGLAKSNRLHEEAEVEGRGESGCLVSAEQHRPTSK